MSGPFSCHFKCGAALKTKYVPKALEWNWFSLGEPTVHFCPQCSAKRSDEIQALREDRLKRWKERSSADFYFGKTAQ